MILLLLGTIALILYAIWSVIELIKSLIVRWNERKAANAEQKRRMTAITPRFKPLHGQRRTSYHVDEKMR